MSIEVRVDLGGTGWDGTFEKGYPPSITITGTEGSVLLSIYDAEKILRLLGKAVAEYKKYMEPEHKP